MGVRLFLSLFAVPRQFSLQPSCHLAVVPLSSFSPLSLLPLPRSATPPPPADPLFSRLLSPFGVSAQLRPASGIFWPLESIELSSRKDDSSDAHCDHLPPSHVVAQVHSLFGHLYLHGRCWRWGPLRVHRYKLTTGLPRLVVFRPPRSLLPRLPSARLYVQYRSAWLTLHAVNRRSIHPIFFSLSSARALVLSLFRNHVWKWQSRLPSPLPVVHS